MEGPGLWRANEQKFPGNYHVIKSSIPIFTIANLKGGVGKTTIATGLGKFDSGRAFHRTRVSWYPRMAADLGGRFYL